MRIFFFLLLAGSLFITGCTNQNSDKDEGAVKDNNENAETEKGNSDPETEYLVTVKTEFGNMIVKLYNETPRHRDNFVKLVQESYYDSLLFHRVINGFMIQGGDPDSKGAGPGARLGQGGPGYTTPAEIRKGLPHKKGALAAARMPDQANPRKESSGSQFYFVHGTVFSDEMLTNIEQQMNKKFEPSVREMYKSLGGAPHLDGDYTVFGEVISGMDVIDQIAALQVDQYSRPVRNIQMALEMSIEN